MDKVTNSPVKKKAVGFGKFPIMETKLCAWVLRKRERNCMLTGVIIRRKAIAILATLDCDVPFNASYKWLRSFKERFGLRHLNANSVMPFQRKFDQKIRQMCLTQDQIYNAYASGLFYRSLPNKTIVSSNEKSASGLKTLKERITFMLCCNVSGTHKIKPLVIGKSKKPGCFRDFENPLEYDSSTSPWITKCILRRWFNSFVRQVREFMDEHNLPIKALLLLHNTISHEQMQSGDGNIVVMFLPLNVKHVDENVIWLTKLYYRQSLLTTLVAKQNEGIEVILKRITIREAILFLKSAWDKVTTEQLKKCSHKIFDRFELTESLLEMNFDEEDNLPLTTFIPRVRVQETIDLLNLLGQPVSAHEFEVWNSDNVSADVQSIEDDSGPDSEEK